MMMIGRWWKLGKRSYKHFQEDVKAMYLALNLHCIDIYIYILLNFIKILDLNASLSECGLAPYFSLARFIHIATAHSFPFSLLFSFFFFIKKYTEPATTIAQPLHGNALP